ncbi:MAG TPA: cobaltochelatase subunit CobN [Pyrinomonadaceae bacterium]|jgi:magnesium chelatase subunit H
MNKPAEERDRRVLELWEQLLEVEQRLIPTGLHVFGRAASGEECADLLRAVASYDRPECGARALTDLVSEGLGLGGYEGLLGDKSEEGFRARARVDELVRAAVEVFLRDGERQACDLLEREARVGAAESQKVFGLLGRVRAQLGTSGELEGLARALRGEYVEPGPGADVVQNPAVLPTGRNTHAVNPYAVPSHAAFARAELVVRTLLERHAAEHGRPPRTMALVLWGLDNIKTQGEGVAQALRLLGVRPVRDSLNRVTEVEPVPLEVLGRPRVDVVMTVSGIFRDLFGATMMLLDKAVRAVAALDEPAELNPVRANVEERVRAEGCERDEALLRVFSNAPGSYGTNVNFMVMDSQWETADALGELFVTRKCFAYGLGRGGRALEGREAREALSRALARVEATYQNVDSFEIGITDVDHYFEYLGGVSKAVERHAQSRPAVYLSDALGREARVRTLPEMVRLETRAKTLNPKWYEGMLGHGFRGVAEIESHVTNTFGWSATADAVDGWVYDEVAETYLLDAEMLGRLSDLNPHSARSLAARLLEAEGRGFWEARPEVVERLREIYASLEDRLEGVA